MGELAFASSELSEPLDDDGSNVPIVSLPLEAPHFI